MTDVEPGPLLESGDDQSTIASVVETWWGPDGLVESRTAPVALFPWFDLQSGSSPAQALEALGGNCPGLTLAMIEELLRADELPEGKRYGEDEEIRTVTSCAITAELTGEDPRVRGEAHVGRAREARLTVQPVELIASPEWLVTCWHPQRIYDGRGGVDKASPAASGRYSSEAVREHLKRAWHECGGETAADFGIQVMARLALSYAPAHRTLHRCLEDWELSLYEQRLADEAAIEDERNRLRRLWRLRATLRDWISPLNLQGTEIDLSEAWLPSGNARAVNALDDRIDKALKSISALGETLRSEFQLLHLEQHEVEREKAEERQRRLERVATVFLVPTLVVGFYGANTWIPGEGENWGFWVMVSVLLILTVTSLAFLRRLHAERAKAIKTARGRPG